MDTKELVSELHVESDCCRNDGATDIANLIDRAISHIESQSAKIAELEAQLRWIPVSERLPEKANFVLDHDTEFGITGDYWESNKVIVKLQNGECAITYCIYHNDKPTWYCWGDFITHWRELDLPKE